MQENINYSNPDDGFGDKLRNAFIKVQNNFTELFNGKVDKVAGKGLSQNDFTDADKSKLTGIEAGAQVNINSDFGENDPDAPGYILNRPPSMYASVGYFDHNDTATQTTPLVLVSGILKKLTNDALGAFTDLSQAPYGVPNIWNATFNRFDFSALSIGDTVDLRVDALLTTTGTNKTYKIYLKLGVDTPSEFTTLVGSGELKAAVTDENIVNEVSFYIGNEDVRDAKGFLYILVDTSGSLKVNGWYTRIIRKGLNVIDIKEGALLNDPTTYSPATLLLTGTEVALLNDGTNWVKITWNNIKAQLKAYFDTLYAPIGGGDVILEKLSDLIDNNLDFDLADFDVTGSATYAIESGNLKVSGGGSYGFDSKALHEKKLNVEEFTAELDWYFADTRTSETYGLAFLLKSISTYYEYSYFVLYDASVGNPNSGKLFVYFNSEGAYTNIYSGSQVIPMATNDKMRYTIHRNKDKYTFMLENLTQNKRTSFYFKSSVSTGFSTRRIVNNVCRFGVAKQTVVDVDFYVERLNVKRNLNKNLDFVFLGDSITFGYETGTDIKERYADLVFSNTKSKKSFGVYAQPGNGIVDCLNLVDETLELNPKNLIINIGMNDAQIDVLASVFIANLESFVTSISDSDINIIFCLIKPYTAKMSLITQYNELIESTFGDSYQIIDTFRPLIKAGNSDLHPNNEEHNLMAQLIQIEIANLL